jgi:hypothetical protein
MFVFLFSGSGSGLSLLGLWFGCSCRPGSWDVGWLAEYFFLVRDFFSLILSHN